MRKINPKIPPVDVCQRSLDWLRTYAEEWFRSNVPNHGKIWFSDENVKGLQDGFPARGEFVEIILTGSFFIRLLESKTWSFEEFRIWTFSSRLKKILNEMFHIPLHQIGIVGREIPIKVSKTPNFMEEINFVYAGRISLTKNVTSLLRLTSHLQTHYNLDVTLDIFGEPDDFPDESIGRFENVSVKDILNQLMSCLPWKKRPTFHGTVPQGSWTTINRNNPIFISLSSSMYEDFGTAAEIASRNGWPCLLSDWGGHADCGNAFLIPMHLVAHTWEPSCFQRLKTEVLASELLKNPSFLVSHQIEKSYIPQAMTKINFQHRIDDFILKWGPEVLFCLREKMDYFADTPKGIDFFRNYHTAFGKKRAQEAFIVNDLKFVPDYHLSRPELSFEVIFTRELFNSFFIKQLGNYKKISILEDGHEFPVIFNFLRNILGLMTPITVLTSSHSSFAFSHLLSGQDEVKEVSL